MKSRTWYLPYAPLTSASLHGRHGERNFLIAGRWLEQRSRQRLELHVADLARDGHQRELLRLGLRRFLLLLLLRTEHPAKSAPGEPLQAAALLPLVATKRKCAIEFNSGRQQDDVHRRLHRHALELLRLFRGFLHSSAKLRLRREGRAHVP